MGERKVLNKYIPADFDPSLVPRGKKLSSKDGTVPVRMMLPFSIQCNNPKCRVFLYRGTKFNSKKEPMGGPHGKYLGIQRWRFYIKCTQCAKPISFLTDPQNADYEMESGATRNYEVHKDKKETEEKFEKEKEEEEKADHMKALENRVLDSQREVADLDNLEEIKAMNRRHIHLLSTSGDQGFDTGVKRLLDKIEGKLGDGDDDNHQGGSKQQQQQLTEEDEALIKSIKFGGQQQLSSSKSNKRIIKRLDEEDEKRADENRQKEIAMLEQKAASQKAILTNSKTAMPIIKIKRRRVDASTMTKATETKPKQPNEDSGDGGGLASLLGGYGSSSDSD
jgi:Saf4/Yju2 protein